MNFLRPAGSGQPVGFRQVSNIRLARTHGDLLGRKQTHFVLWRPAPSTEPPRLVIGAARPGVAVEMNG